MEIPEWEEIAIPEGFGPYRLLYNPPSETVIAELRSIGEQFFPNQLYFRKKDSPRYEPIKGFEQMVSSESAVTSLERPLLFYLSNKLTKMDEGGFSGIPITVRRGVDNWACGCFCRREQTLFNGGNDAARFVGRVSNGQPSIGTNGLADRQHPSRFSSEGDILLGAFG